MLKNYIKIALKNILRQKLIVVINLIGLSASLTCCIIAYLNWEFDNSYNAFHENSDRIFKINSVNAINNNLVDFAIVPLPMAPALENEVDGIDKAVRYTESREDLVFGQDRFTSKLGFVDSHFLDVFSFKLASGTALQPDSKSEVLISQRLAEKHFKDENPIGKVIIVDYKANGEKSYTVQGVYENIPLNSSFNFDMLLTFENFLELAKIEKDDWSSFVLTSFVMLNDPSQKDKVQSQLNKYVRLQNEAREDLKTHHFYLDALPDMAGNLENLRANVLQPGLPSSAVITPIIMALLMLLLACFNYVNSAMAMSGRRLREIGLRKVFGGTRVQVMVQFLTENFIVCFIAIVFAVVLAYFAVPAYSSLWSFLDLEFNYFQNPQIILLSIGLLIITGTLAGAYPAFYVGAFDPSKIFSENFKSTGTNNFMRLLLLLQLSIVLMALIAGMSFSQNADYQRELEMGFNHNQTIVVNVNSKSQYDLFSNKLSQDPRLISLSGSEGHIGRNAYNSNLKSGDKEMFVEGINISSEFMETAGLKLVAGRNFEKDSRRDEDESILVTEQMVREFGWTEPLNKKVFINDSLQMYVIGVVKDVYMRGLWQPIKPLFLRMTNENSYRFLTAKVKAEDLYVTKTKLEKVWKSTFPNQPFNSYLQEEMLYEAKTINNNIETVFFILSLVALFISAAGLFSMLSLNIAKRSKEFGLRKILGGSKINIAYHITKEFMIIFSVSTIVGIVSAYFFVEWLLGSIYTYHTNVNLFPIMAATLVLLAIALITICYKVIKTAMSAPVQVIRN